METDGFIRNWDVTLVKGQNVLVLTGQRYRELPLSKSIPV
jgi:hypothetical protein